MKKGLVKINSKLSAGVETNTLPRKWTWEKLGDACDVITGTTPPKSDPSNYGSDIPFFKPPHLWDGLISETEEMLSKKGGKLSRMIPPHTVLVTCIGNLGRTGFVKKHAAFNQQINAILENDRIIGKYIFYQAQSPLFKKQLESLATGTTVSIVNKGNFETIEIPIPPIETQHIIVSKIEELFSELEKGIESLKLAQQQLKVYRQSVLKWAFEGRLTNEDVKEGELPKGWKISRVNDLKNKDSNSICAGPFGTIFKAKDFRNSGIPIIFLRHVKAGFYNTRKPGYMDELIWDKIFKDYSVYGGELLITKLGDPPGECAIFPLGIGPAMVTPDVIKMKVDEDKVVPKYLMYYFNSENSRKALEDIAFGTTRLRITIPIFRNLPVPLCKKEEQESIVNIIESKFCDCNKMEESINQSLLQSVVLRQSILKKAFEGKLA